MPSPVGHALGALAVGWTVAPRAATARAAWAQAACIVAFGVAPDLDLLIGRHSAETHSVGAALIAASVAAALRWPFAVTRLRIWIVACLAWLSHPLLDAFGTDHAPPIGIMVWWPFSHSYHLTGWELFWPISRRWSGASFLIDNIAAAGREVLILGPLAVIAWWIHTRRPAGSAGSKDPAYTLPAE